MRGGTPALQVADRLPVPSQAAQDRSGIRRPRYATVLGGVLPDGFWVWRPVRI